MIETLKAYQGLGLAAPQIGQWFRIIIAQPNPEEEPLVLINPQIEKTSRRKETMEEGCLSLHGISGLVERPTKIVLEAIDINGQIIKIKAKGLLARIIQHEIDHLDGILIVDKIQN